MGKQPINKKLIEYCLGYASICCDDKELCLLYIKLATYLLDGDRDGAELLIQVNDSLQGKYVLKYFYE
jgi:hypothetical protein